MIILTLDMKRSGASTTNPIRQDTQSNSTQYRLNTKKKSKSQSLIYHSLNKGYINAKKNTTHTTDTEAVKTGN